MINNTETTIKDGGGGGTTTTPTGNNGNGGTSNTVTESYGDGGVSDCNDCNNSGTTGNESYGDGGVCDCNNSDGYNKDDTGNSYGDGGVSDCENCNGCNTGGGTTTGGGGATGEGGTTGGGGTTGEGGTTGTGGTKFTCEECGKSCDCTNESTVLENVCCDCMKKLGRCSVCGRLVKTADKFKGRYDVHKSCSGRVRVLVNGPRKVQVGKSISFAATTTYGTNWPVTWSVTDDSIAEIDSSGVLWGKKAGAVGVIATIDHTGCNSQYRVTVEKIATTVDPNVSNVVPVEIPTVEKTTDPIGDAVVQDPIDAYSGAHLLNNTAFALAGGQNLKLVLEYRSDRFKTGEVGVGWNHNFEKRLEVMETEARLYEGESVYLQFVREDATCCFFNCTTLGKKTYTLDCENGIYRLNRNNDVIEYYLKGNLIKIETRQGYVTEIAHNSDMTVITDCVSNRKLYLKKNANGRIITAYDDAGRSAIFEYSGKFLTKIIDSNGKILVYDYDDKGRIKRGYDDDCVCYFENTYDANGRVVTQQDALGNPISTFEYFDDGRRKTTNRNGDVSIREFNTLGQLLKLTDENGNVKTYAYDNNGNLVRETDGNGNSTLKVFNVFNKVERATDKNGNTTVYGYDTVGNLTSVTYPAVNGVSAVESFEYDEKNRLIKHTDLRGTVTVYEYDRKGMPKSKKIGDKPAVHYTYEYGFKTSETDALGNRTYYEYDENDFVESKTDALGAKTSYVYDQSGKPIEITDPAGNKVFFEYDSNYMPKSETDANGNKTSYVYNANLKLEKTTYADGNEERYEYDGEDRPIRFTDRAGNVTVSAYDKGGRVISKTAPDGACVTYEYDGAGRVIKQTNAKGAVSVMSYDANGNVLSVTDCNGNTVTSEYDALGRVVKKTDAANNSITYTYNAAGDVIAETDARGKSVLYTYDAYGNVLTATDRNGNTVSYTYDANNNLLTVTDALGGVSEYTYNALNACVSVKDALGNVITYTYDTLGRKTAITDARGNTFTTVYDAHGNVVRTTDGKGNTVSETVYNALNLPLTVKDALGKTVSYAYNALGKTETVTDPTGNTKTFTYDSMGRNNRVKDEMNGESFVTFDLLGNVTRLEGPMGAATEYVYDNMGRLLSESTVSGYTKRYEYNERNVRSKITNARNQVREITYDANGRVAGYTAPEGTVSYTYDDNGNVLTVTDRKGTIRRTYDVLNRVASYTDTYGKVIRYEYDAVGNMTKLTYPDGSAVNYTYDANHNPLTVTDWMDRVTSYTYDENNRVIGVTKPDGSVTTTVYDNMQRVVSTVERTADGAVITGFEYTYDDLSRIVEEKVLANSTKFCYTYDDLGRVTARSKKTLDGVLISAEVFSHDAAGNVTSACGSCVQYDTNNRLTVFDGNPVYYDRDGNMLDNGVCCFGYDSANRLVTVCDHEYTYNAEDVRIRKLCDTEDTIYTYNTNAKLSQLLTKTTCCTETKYVYGIGLIGEEENGAFKTYHFDCRGSTVAVTDECGNITDTFAYDTYGKLIGRTGTSDIIFKYNGRDGVITDGNGLIYMRARYYSPDMRRFVNADIVAGSISNAVTLNRFAYANGNPVSFVDPFGLSVASGIVKFGKGINNAFNKSKEVLKTSWNATKEVVSAVWHNGDEAVDALLHGNAFDWGVNKFKELTREGKLDNTIDLFIGTTPDENDVYHIDQKYWQSIHFVGYNDLYDKAFDFGVGLTGYTVDKKKFSFTTDTGKDYIIWMWKGDYVNLGAGAEVGIYEESVIPGHYLTSAENSMPMSLKLVEIDSGDVIFDYNPSELQWWINGFSPANQNAFANNLQVTVTIDFSGKEDLFEAFIKSNGERWDINDTKATYVWGRK